MRRRWIAVALALTTVGALAAQTPKPTFDVVSVKASPVTGGPLSVVSGVRQGNRFIARNATLWRILRKAYGKEFPTLGQVIGGPSWIDRDRFDIEATFGGSPSEDELSVMVQSLLSDRFRLVTRVESRELPIFSLRLHRGATLGPQIRLLKGVDCEVIRRSPGQPLAANGPEPPLCTTLFGFGATSDISSGGITMAQLASMLEPHVGRPVHDDTKLAGYFSLSLSFAADPGARSPFGPLPPVPDTPADVATDSPSLFTALQEQLGLRLESTRGPVDVLVIDSVQQPIEN